MHTINAMVRIGPWTITHVVDRGKRDGACERCSTPIRYEYHVVLDEHHDPGELGKHAWVVGSKCGPDLAEASAEFWSPQWKSVDAEVRSIVGRLVRMAAIEAAAASNPGKVDSQDIVRMRTHLDDAMALEDWDSKVWAVRRCSRGWTRVERALGLKPPR